MKKLHGKGLLVVLAVTVFLSGLCFSPSEVAAASQYVTIGTASIGGMFYPTGMAMAKIWNREIPEMKAVAIATGGSPHNVEMLRTKEIEVAVLRSLEGWRAINGKDPYPEKIPSIRALTGPLYLVGAEIYARKGAGIKSISDFKGKRVAVGPIGSGGEIDAREYLAAYGLTYDDIKPEYVEASQAVDMMKDNLIDGAILGLSTGGSAQAELFVLNKIDLLPFTDEVIKKLIESRAGTVEFVIPANTYSNQPYDVKTVATPPMIMVVREDIPEELAYQMTKALYENADEVRQVGKTLRQFKLENAAKKILVPYHEGSSRYFKEKGIIQ